jgi:hypothetical protein
MSAGRGSGAHRAAPGVFRIRWLPGTDVLLGTCHCDAEHRCQDPVEMWDWLLRHPDHPDRRERPAHFDRTERPDHRDRTEHPDRPDPEDRHR